MPATGASVIPKSERISWNLDRPKVLGRKSPMLLLATATLAAEGHAALTTAGHAVRLVTELQRLFTELQHLVAELQHWESPWRRAKVSPLGRWVF